MDIPEDFWPLFESKIRTLAAVYNPVSVARLYPFMVSRLPADMTFQILARAQERGLIEIFFKDFNRGTEHAEKVPMVRLK